MTTAPHPIDRAPRLASARPGTGLLIRRGALAGAVAAVGTTAVAAIASAADVDLAVAGEAIPVAAFTLWTVVGAVLGIGLARLLGERRRFVVVTSVAVALSLPPAVAAPDDLATRAVLVGAHLLAAAIIIPMLARVLPSAAEVR